MNIPADLSYTKTHEWARLADDGLVAVGITDHAQDLLGDIVFLELPQPGRRIAAGDECAVVESVKAAADIYAPLAGEIVAFNQALQEQPEQVNKDAYAAWLFKIKPDDAGQLDKLMDANAYQRLLDSEEK